eukprot:3158118-Pyramimonas_sp.AAC.1
MTDKHPDRRSRLVNAPKEGIEQGRAVSVNAQGRLVNANYQGRDGFPEFGKGGRHKQGTEYRT